MVCVFLNYSGFLMVCSPNQLTLGRYFCGLWLSLILEKDIITFSIVACVATE